LPGDAGHAEAWFRPGDEQARALRQEALTEIGLDHELVGRHLDRVAACSGCDLVVLQVDDGTFAIVQLTWTGRLETAPWPTARRFETARACLRRPTIINTDPYDVTDCPATSRLTAWIITFAASAVAKSVSTGMEGRFRQAFASRSE
jgi:hypothetical protein